MFYKKMGESEMHSYDITKVTWRGFAGIIFLFLALSVLFAIQNVGASPIPRLTQTINEGVLSVDVLDDNQSSVPNPTVPFTLAAVEATCQQPGATGTLGSNLQRVYVDNPGGADSGWSLALAATGGPATLWSNGSDEYDFNDPAGGGCNDGGDVDAAAGQLTINPSVASLTLDCGGTCSASGVSLGTQAAFSQGTTDVVNLVTAGAGADDIWRGYLTGIQASQSLPAAQSAGAYVLDVTLTATAL